MSHNNEALERIIDEAKTIFSQYLERHSFRKTPERYTILEEIYRRNDHFDAEALYIHMKAQNYRVSRATVYNTLDLLVNCDLVTKHQFGKNTARYEKSYGYRQHDHIICVECGKVLEFCDPRIQQIKDVMGDLMNFDITHHSLNLYGQCNINCEHKAKQQSTSQSLNSPA